MIKNKNKWDDISFNCFFTNCLINHYLEERMIASKNNDNIRVASIDEQLRNTTNQHSTIPSTTLSNNLVKTIPAYDSEWQDSPHFDTFEKYNTITSKCRVIEKILHTFLSQPTINKLSKEVVECLLYHPLLSKTSVVNDLHGKRVGIYIDTYFTNFTLPNELKRFENDIVSLLDEMYERCERIFIIVNAKELNLKNN